MITGTALATSNSAHQEQACMYVHTCKEVLKWRSSSRPNNIIAERKSKDAKIKGHVVIEDMLDNDVKLLPASIDPFMKEGPALHLFRYGNTNKAFDLSNHDFGNAQGTQACIAMSKQSLEDGDMRGVICKADITWKHLHNGNRLFGETHKDQTPSAWSSQFLAT
eukprot:13337094-Ditylum_brightwellii.AAC.1